MSKCKHDFAPAGQGMSVTVRDNNVDQALRALKKKVQRGGVFGEIKAKKHFIPGTKVRRAAEAKARGRAFKLEVKKLQKEGLTKEEAKVEARLTHSPR